MKIFISFTILVLLKSVIYRGYFLDPNDLNPNILLYAGGNIKQYYKIDFKINEFCGNSDEFDFRPWPHELFVYACNVLKGCEADYQIKMNRTVVPLENLLLTFDLNKLLNCKFVTCKAQTFPLSSTENVLAYNDSYIFRSRNFYQTIVTFYETSLVEDSMNILVSNLFRYVDYPLELPELYYAYDVTIKNKQCRVIGGILYRTTCDDNYFGPQCLYICIPDHRKLCGPRAQYQKESCVTGWTTIPVNVTITNRDNCESFYIKNEVVQRCLVIDKCRVKTGRTVCPFSFSCVPIRNNTAICAKYVIYYSNPYDTKTLNFTRKNVLDKEVIYIHIDQVLLENVSYQIYQVYWFHSQEITFKTPTSEKRTLKNSELIVEGNKLTIFTRFEGFGYDYSIYAVVQTGVLRHEKFKWDFTIIVPPKTVIINNLIYIYYYDILDIIVDGWPDKYKYVIVSRPDISSVIRFPVNRPFRFPNWKPKLFNMEVIINFNTRDGFNKNISATSHHSTRGFDAFSWEDSPYILKENDVLRCIYGNRSKGQIMIRQVFGETELDDIIDSHITIKNLKPGEYIIACVLRLSQTSDIFHRYKAFEIHQYPSKLCILPFAPAVGMLIKCVCIVFPPGNDDYTMVLFDLKTQSIIRTTQSNFLRIPYIILHDMRYQVRCRYKDIYQDQVIDIIKNVDFNLDDNSEVAAINFNRECMDYGTLPDEYNIKESNTSDIYVFYNQLFYLKRSSQMEYNVYIIIIAIAFNDGVIYIICGAFKISDRKRLASIFLQTEKIYRRNFMRRINNKITNVSSREVEASKDLFESFRSRHQSIEDDSRDDPFEHDGENTGTFKVYMNILEHI